MSFTPPLQLAPLPADLGPEGFNSRSFHSISILLHANASLIALQLSSASLYSFPIWTLFVCAPVPCSHPCSFHPHVYSCPSYRYYPVFVLIDYLCFQPCDSIPYK